MGVTIEKKAKLMIARAQQPDKGLVLVAEKSAKQAARFTFLALAGHADDAPKVNKEAVSMHYVSTRPRF